MKKLLVSAVSVCLLLTAASAMAGDGQVSKISLVKLGLSGMSVISDSQGMQVRGQSSNASSDGMSLVFGVLLFSNNNGTSFIAGSDTNKSRGTAENGGLQVLSQAGHAQASGINLQLVIVGQFAGQAIGGAGGSGFAFGQ